MPRAARCGRLSIVTSRKFAHIGRMRVSTDQVIVPESTFLSPLLPDRLLA